MYRVQFYRERLKRLLSVKKIQLSELPIIQASLEQEARVARGNLKKV
jgi:hypothetical protein